MKRLHYLAILLASICLTISSIGQTVSPVLVYGNFNLYSGASNRMNGLTIFPIQAISPIPLNGGVLNPQPLVCNSASYPLLLTGVLTNAPLYPGFEYALTNSAGTLGMVFQISSSASSPFNICDPTNLLYSTNSTDFSALFGFLNSIYQPLSTNLNQWATIGTNVLGSGGTTYTNNTGAPGVISGSGIGTNTTALVTSNQLWNATNNLGRSASVTMTNGGNAFTGSFTANGGNVVTNFQSKVVQTNFSAFGWTTNNNIVTDPSGNVFNNSLGFTVVNATNNFLLLSPGCTIIATNQANVGYDDGQANWISDSPNCVIRDDANNDAADNVINLCGSSTLIGASEIYAYDSIQCTILDCNNVFINSSTACTVIGIGDGDTLVNSALSVLVNSGGNLIYSSSVVLTNSTNLQIQNSTVTMINCNGDVVQNTGAGSFITNCSNLFINGNGNAVFLTNVNNQMIGTFTGNGSGLTNIPLKSITTNGIAGAAVGMVATVKSDGTMTLSNAPAGGTTLSTNFVLLSYAHNASGASDTNVVVDFSTATNGVGFILPVTNNVFLIPSNISYIVQGIGATILATNNSAGGWSFAYTNCLTQSSNTLTLTTNGGAMNLLSFLKNASATKVLMSQNLNWQ